MKRCLVIFSAVFFVLLTINPLLASENSHSLKAGLTYLYFDYKELNLTEPLKSTESGFLPGLHLTYNYQGKTNPLYARIYFEYIEEKTNYDGTTQAGTPVTDKTKNKFYNGEVNVGYIFKPASEMDSSNIAFYTGFGYGYWKRGLGGAVPYSEDYTWKYLPLGFRGTYQIDKKWAVGADLALWIIVAADIKVYFSEIDSNYNNPETKLENKLGWKLEIPVNYRLAKHWSLVLAPAYEFYSFGRGDDFTITYAGVPVARGYEPSSRTHKYVVRLSLKVDF